jgi:hypothetical protein
LVRVGLPNGKLFGFFGWVLGFCGSGIPTTLTTKKTNNTNQHEAERRLED